MSNMAKRHSQVVHQAAEMKGRGPTSLARDLTANISDSIKERWAAAQDSFDDDMNHQELVAYMDVMKMMSEIVGEKMNRPSCPEAGTFASICFSEQDVGPVVVRQMRTLLTLGAKTHLEKQIYEEWSAEIDEAVTQGRLKRVTAARPSESRQQKIRSYVGFSYHLGNLAIPADAAFSPNHAAISDSMNVHVPVWALLYHCLRVGELDGAINEIQSCRNAGLQIDDATLVCLRCMKELTQPNAPPLTPLKRQELYNAMYTCQQLFEEEFDKPSQDPCAPHSRDNYKALVLNLLSSSADQDAMSELLDAMLGSNFQIEDFLWGSLWFVTWANVAQLEDSAAQGALPNALVNLRSKGEEALYAQIVAMGGVSQTMLVHCFPPIVFHSLTLTHSYTLPPYTHKHTHTLFCRPPTLTRAIASCFARCFYLVRSMARPFCSSGDSARPWPPCTWR